MAAAARQLFAAEPEAGLPSQRYLVAAGMLGSIAAGKPAEARELWERYRGLPGAGEDLLLHVLVARSTRDAQAPPKK